MKWTELAGAVSGTPPSYRKVFSCCLMRGHWIQRLNIGIWAGDGLHLCSWHGVRVRWRDCGSGLSGYISVVTFPNVSITLVTHFVHDQRARSCLKTRFRSVIPVSPVLRVDPLCTFCLSFPCTVVSLTLLPPLLPHLAVVSDEFFALDMRAAAPEWREISGLVSGSAPSGGLGFGIASSGESLYLFGGSLGVLPLPSLLSLLCPSLIPGAAVLRHPPSHPACLGLSHLLSSGASEYLHAES
eukprot:1510399-Rhodomonas_salina.2